MWSMIIETVLKIPIFIAWYECIWGKKSKYKKVYIISGISLLLHIILLFIKPDFHYTWKAIAMTVILLILTTILFIIEKHSLKKD